MKKTVLLFLLLSCVYGLNAQKNDFSEYTKASIQRIKPVILDDTLSGYYFFSKGDQKSKEEDNYFFTLFDTDLKEVNTINLSYPKRAVILDIAHNGATLCIVYMVTTVVVQKNPDSEYFIDFISNDGQKKTVRKFYKNKEEINIPSDQVSRDQFRVILPVKNKGFIIQFYKQAAFSSSKIFEAYDNTGALLWSQNDASSIEASNNMILIYKTIKNEAKPGGSYLSINVRDFSNTSTLSFDYSRLHDEEHFYYAFDVLENNGFYYVIQGKYKWDIKKNGKKRVNMNQNPSSYVISKLDSKGEDISEKSVAGSFNDTYSDEFSETKMGSFNYYEEQFHLRKVLMRDNSFYFFGEKYSKGKNIEYKIYKLDTSLTVINSSVNKSSYKATLGYDFGSEEFGYRTSKVGGTKLFGGQFIGTDNEYFYNSFSSGTNSSSILYTDFSPEEGKLNVFNNEMMGLNEDGTYFFSKLNFKLSSTYYQIMPAKPGYVCIFEYFEKEKKIDFRLEKFDF